MNELGCIKVDVAMSDSAYYAHAPHDSVTLPMAPSDLQGVIDRVSRFGSHGYEIKDIQTSGVIDKLHFAEDENVSLRALNAMAECVKRNPDIDYDAVRDYCDNFDVPVDPLMVGNVIMQAGQMPYTSYSVDVDNEHPTPSTCNGHAESRLSTALPRNSRPAWSTTGFPMVPRRASPESSSCSQTYLPRHWVPRWSPVEKSALPPAASSTAIPKASS